MLSSISRSVDNFTSSDMFPTILSILLVLDLRFTGFLGLAVLKIFTLLAFLYQTVFHAYEPVPAYFTRGQLRFHGWLVHADIFIHERPPPPPPGKIRNPSAPHANDDEYMRPVIPNKQPGYEEKVDKIATAIWEQRMSYDVPSPTKHSAGSTPAKRRVAPLVHYSPPSPSEPVKKPLTDMEVARCDVAYAKLTEMLDETAEHQARELSMTANISRKDAKELLQATGGRFSTALHQINLLKKANDFAAYTSMYLDTARDYLAESDWDAEKAIQRLEYLHSKGLLQAEWFVNGLPAPTTQSSTASSNGVAGQSSDAPYTGSNEILLRTDKAARIQRIRDIMENTDLNWSRFNAQDAQGTCPFKGDFKGDCGQLKYEMDSIVEALTFRSGVWDESIVARADANKCLLRKTWFRKLGEELNKCSESYAKEAVQAMLRLNSLIPDEWNLQWS